MLFYRGVKDREFKIFPLKIFNFTVFNPTKKQHLISKKNLFSI